MASPSPCLLLFFFFFFFSFHTRTKQTRLSVRRYATTTTTTTTTKPSSVSLLVPPRRRSSIRVSRSENSSVLVGAPNEPEIRSEPRVSNGRYGAQLTLKYHRCGSVRDGIRYGARLRWGFQGERGIWARDKGPKDRPILWTPKLADRSFRLSSLPSRSPKFRPN